MKNISVHEFLGHLRLYFQEGNATKKYSKEPPPLRAELYNTAQMADLGRSLARAHKVNKDASPDFLIKRLAENEKILVKVRKLLVDAIKGQNVLTPGGEWILDNFYLIEEQVRIAKRHFPKGYSNGLPKLTDGPSAGLPRVYDIAIAIISHSDGRIDPENLNSFLHAYQEIVTLELGELWAIPIMLRLALIENLRRVSARIAIDRINQDLADYWSDQMIKTSEHDPKSLILVIADMARSGPPMESSFVAELTRQLMWKGPALLLPLTWMEQRLSESGTTSAELVSGENQKQAADQVSISNSIGSLRFVSAMEWRKFVESVSIVEQKLRASGDATYSRMDFATRDHYRHVIERVAKYSCLSETQVADIVISLAREQQVDGQPNERYKHVGYYLIDDGLFETEKRANIKLPLQTRLRRKVSKLPAYLGAIFIITAVLSAIAVYNGYQRHLPLGWLIAAGLLSVVCTSQLAISLVNWLATLMVRPNLLPRMDFSEQVPVEFKTLVIIPTMLTSPAGVESLVEGLEIRYLANKGTNIYYSLLTDFADAPQEHMPADDELTTLADKRIKELNARYGGGKDIFYLFHRPRLLNKYDNIWMGYERKRGKITALNLLLTNGKRDAFSLITGDLANLQHIKYVITLDTDTQLPRDAAWKLIASKAHPLNQPFYDEKKSRVTEGYGIMQPRVAVSMPRTTGSLYNQIHAGDAGIDPYTRLTSDVYQDLFDEGSFIGKGIYDIETFELALNERFPENRILSHDLLEGCYTRSGLISDVQLYEEYPSKYSTDVSRRHRWIRGDWQIAWWCLPIIPDAKERFKKNRLSALSRWKIFDNLRRSLSPVALTVLLILGWTVLRAPWFYTISVVGVIVLPSIVSALWGVVRVPKEASLRRHIIYSMTGLGNSIIQNIYTVVCLPYEAYYSLDAILRTSWRMLVSHRNLLEWTTSGEADRRNRNSLSVAFTSMWVGPLLSVALSVWLAIYYSSGLAESFPLLVLWTLSPVVNWWVSRPREKRGTNLTPQQTDFLHRLSRRNWAFFETFVCAGDNWLPPDNYQENPKEVVAHRTSPTNIGLALLANLAAYDFGYIDVQALTRRTADTLATMARMERFKGHFYNWYDTITLMPLAPRYISTVDSGNLAGHLLTLKQGLAGLIHAPVCSRRNLDGLLDTIGILEEEKADTPELRAMRDRLSGLRELAVLTPALMMAELKWLTVTAEAIHRELSANKNEQIAWWAQKLLDQATALLEGMQGFIPGEAEAARLQAIPSLAALAAGTTGISDPAAQQRAKELVDLIGRLQLQCDEMADMEYEFLYDNSKHLLTIGYNPVDNRKDNGSYDLLASEARLCIFVAIAQGKLPQDSWFALGRLLTNTAGNPILLSWSGSMFEYLMPNLVMPDYEHTLLYQTNEAVVERQIAYGEQRGVPWGISESGYNMVDANLNYQYRAFGVPGLGLKRGLGDDLVIAPYASCMALMIKPYEACVNLQRMDTAGFKGRYGFYEAIDYTPARIQRGQDNAVVQSFMVHHKGMGFLALAYLLLDQPMQKRFESELQFQASLLLLQERVPKTLTAYTHKTDIDEVKFAATDTELRVITTPNTAVPEIQLLSNDRYYAMITNSGGGYSCWKNIAVTRWREDTTRDNWGTFCYIRDVEDNTFWSNTYQPTLKKARTYEAVFTQGRAEFKRHDNYIETNTEVVVSPEDDIELRRLHITNKSSRRRIIEVTSYAEVVLNSPGADIAHPAFSKLFVQTEILPQQQAIICTRRPNSDSEHLPWLCHLLKVHGVEAGQVSFETDRMQFIGRGNTTEFPKAMHASGKLGGNQGSVLDPIVSIRYRIKLEPGECAILDMIIGMSDTREGCRSLIDKYQDRHHTDRILELAWTHSQVVLRQINASEEDAQLYNRLAGSIVFQNPVLRAEPAVLASNTRGQSGLWSYSISGDLPIVLLRIKDPNNIMLVKQLVQAHAYWKLKGLPVDLVIWIEDFGGYRQNLFDQISGLISAGASATIADRPGGIFIRNADQLSKEDAILFQTVARVIIMDDRGSLADQVTRRAATKSAIAPLSSVTATAFPNAGLPVPADLQFFNGTGGFSKDGREYVIITSQKHVTPAPWVNIIANAGFGSVISESGQSYTWIENAHEERLTPWDNDPVSDSSGECFYVRDEESGQFWSPAALPARGGSVYITRHGFGYSVFEHMEQGIQTAMCVFADLEYPVKFISIKVRNTSGVARRISLTGYVEWVLGDIRSKSGMHIITDIDPESGAIFARNPYSADFAGKTAFFGVDETNRTYTADRNEFLGRNGSLSEPAAMGRTRLSNKTGASLDACGALQVVLDLPNGAEEEVVFYLGAARSAWDAGFIINKYRRPGAVSEALAAVKEYWNNTLGAIRVTTPDVAFNLMANGWLMYQTIACRLWARSGYYQSGGAFGFRDQLQDIIAITYTEPRLAREQILLSASRQFPEGDVQHWWHPPAGRGVRTRCSDDYLWLPFATCNYVIHTGDTGILNEAAGFLENRLLNPEEESNYDLPATSLAKASLYDHCVLAVKHGLRYGVNGLPLMGSGDWNDGMDKVGIHGKGESIWLAFFLYDVLQKFSEVATMHNDPDFARTCLKEAEQLKANINKNGWDGKWYRRAYFDDGTPLGSATNAECSIDSISQSWSVLSGAGETGRSVMAMNEVNLRLVDRKNKLIQLLDPAFDKSNLNPGYIKGYVPGVRENGGQYSHAAVWTIMAFAHLGENKLTWELMNMINPVNHARDAAETGVYKVEPYVMAADVYKVSTHLGRGGWTWYTGSAGWMYQAMVRSVLGIVVAGNKLDFNPCMPAEWSNVKIDYRLAGSVYHIELLTGAYGAVSVSLDGTGQPDGTIVLLNDGKDHVVTVKIPAKTEHVAAAHEI